MSPIPPCQAGGGSGGGGGVQPPTKKTFVSLFIPFETAEIHVLHRLPPEFSRRKIKSRELYGREGLQTRRHAKKCFGFVRGKLVEDRIWQNELRHFKCGGKSVRTRRRNERNKRFSFSSRGVELLMFVFRVLGVS